MTSLIDTAICHLSERSYSVKELRSQLEKDFTYIPDLDKAINSVITRLNDLQLLNDHYLARTFAYRYSHKGNRFIQRMLEQKGISSDVIEEALDSLADESYRALEEARKQLRENPNKSTEDLCRFLSGRNFSIRAINEVLQLLTKNQYILKPFGNAA